ncbi:MAG: bifunctional riboflavin kinase/FAD synthetase [Anaerolineae bacterium]
MSETANNSREILSPYLDFGLPNPESDSVVTIGTFDGVHLGHQHLIRQVIARAHELNYRSAALTFVPHPRTVLRPELPLAYLTNSQERVNLLHQQGLDWVLVAKFSPELAGTSAETFMRALVHQVRMRELWIGHDFRLGHGREGDEESLRRLGLTLGYTVRSVEALLHDGRPINSTRIRELIASGDIQEAAELLGRRYSLTGQVIPGRHVGRTLGIRTANIACDPERVIPADGVYAAWVKTSRKRYMAAVNVGNRPSFGPSERLLEVHILDFQGNLYHRTLTIEFVRYLRHEMHFPEISALVAQVQHDIAETRAILSADS